MASELSIRRAQVHVPDTCAWCDSIQDVNWYCNDCQEALCDRCIETHKRARRTRNDNVVPIKEAIKLGKAVLPEVCKTHPGKTCDLYCCDCNVVMCAICFTEKHTQHIFKSFEEEINSQKLYMRDQLNTLKTKFDHFNDNLSKRNEASKSFKESVDAIRQTVQSQRLTLKAHVDSVVDSVLVELASMVEEEEKGHSQECRSHEKNIKAIKQLIRDVEEQTDKISSESLFALTGRLRTTIPLYDVTVQSVLPRPPGFVIGQPNIKQLKTMIGYLDVGKLNNKDIGYEMKEVDSQQVQHMSTVQVPQKFQINSICPTDDTRAWMAVLDSNELIQVNKEGKVTESVKLDFKPWCVAVTSTVEMLLTRQDSSPLIHKLSNDRRVSRFADISPLKARGISISDSEEVLVITKTPTILVLNMSGDTVRQLSCECDGRRIVCMTTGNVAVAIGEGFSSNKLIILNKSNQITHTWTGELDNGQTLKKTSQCSIACDRYDRVFVPDYYTNQVYVISGNERKAKCLLDKKHGVKGPTAVCVDKCGHVWIGCNDGTVHVMQL